MATNNATGFPILDEDDMVSDSAGSLATQQSIKAYIDSVPSAGFQKISTAVISSDSEIVFTLPSGYISFRFEFFNIVPATSSVDLQCEFSGDGGLTWDTGDSDYNQQTFVIQFGGTTISAGTNDSFIPIMSQPFETAASNFASGYFTLYDPLNASRRTVYQLFCMSKGSTSAEYKIAGGSRLADKTIDAVRFYFSSGNLSLGTIVLYGKKG